MEPRPPCFITPFFSKVLTQSMSYFQEQFHKLEVVVFYTDTSIELRTSF